MVEIESTILYSGKSLATIRQEGGIGHWTASAERVKQCKYAVVVRNMREHMASRDVGHGTAFMITDVSSIVPSAHTGRIIIQFKKYCLINIPDAWRTLTRGQRFPVAYLPTDPLLQMLGLNPETLEWKSFDDIPEVPKQKIEENRIMTFPKAPEALTTFASAIHQAKRDLANLLGINTKQIDITITL